MRYAGFWYRLAAGIVDAVIQLAVFVVGLWLASTSHLAGLLVWAPLTAFYAVYNVYFHARWGRTIGKMVAGIRVVKTSGAPITLREAVLRSSVDIGFLVLYIVATYTALLAIPAHEYERLGWFGQSKALQALKPAWWHWADILDNIWVWSEVVVVLFNPQKRALHDFIAGTVVIVTRGEAPSSVLY